MSGRRTPDGELDSARPPIYLMGGRELFLLRGGKSRARIGGVVAVGERVGFGGLRWGLGV